MDKLNPEQRSKNMAAVKGKDTVPEMHVRRMLHKMGFRFRLHRKYLPGKPDIVLPKHRICIFVHGCFWHQHPNCKRATVPETNKDFWETKFRKTVKRDMQTQNDLLKQGWRVFIIWECETKQDNILAEVIRNCIKKDT